MAKAITGTAAILQANQIATGIGRVAILGILNRVSGSDILSSVGTTTTPIIGILSVTQDIQTLIFIGNVKDSGFFTEIQDNQSLVSSGTLGPAAIIIHGVLDVIQEEDRCFALIAALCRSRAKPTGFERPIPFCDDD